MIPTPDQEEEILREYQSGNTSQYKLAIKWQCTRDRIRNITTPRYRPTEDTLCKCGCGKSMTALHKTVRRKHREWHPDCQDAKRRFQDEQKQRHSKAQNDRRGARVSDMRDSPHTRPVLCKRCFGIPDRRPVRGRCKCGEVYAEDIVERPHAISDYDYTIGSIK
jgi:hypothetical protein